MQAAIDLLSSFLSASRNSKIDHVISHRTNNIRLVLENITDPHNAAACIRTAEAYGVQHVHVINSNNKFSLAESITAGADRWVSLQQHKSTEECISTVKSLGYSLCVSDLETGTRPIHEIKSIYPNFSLTQPKLSFVFGNETYGVSSTMKKVSDFRFILPMVGFTQSFNISVSVSVCLTYLKAYGLLEPSFTNDEKQKLKLEWLLKEIDGDVNTGKQVLRQRDLGHVLHFLE